MRNNKLILIFAFILKFISINNSFVLIDFIFKNIIVEQPKCHPGNKDIERYRGAIKNIEDIDNNFYKSSNNQLSDKVEYSFIYFPKEEQLYKHIGKLPDFALIFTAFEVDFIKIGKPVCYLKIQEWSNYHYIFVSDKKVEYLALPVIFIPFCISVIISVYKGYKETLNRLVFRRKIYFYDFTRRMILLSILLGLSTIIIYYYFLAYIIYSIYKTYLIINLILLLEGFSIIHFNDSHINHNNYLLYFYLFDFISSFFSEYIVYIIPSLDNFYLFHLKSMIEHGTFLVIIFIFFKTKYIHLVKQYLFEKRLGSVLSISYKIKNDIYLKIMIFSIVYCSAFIILPFIEKIYIKIDDDVETFHLNYFITICLELAFNLALVILLFPRDLTLYYFLPTIFDYNTFKMTVIIKKRNKKQLNISNITHQLLKEEYQEKEYPLVFINPFCKTNDVFNGLHVGLIKKHKESHS
jgi:hypothetical protein